MNRMFYLLLIILLNGLSAEYVNGASAKNLVYYRDFLNAQYRSKPLSYCSLDHKTCGSAIANRYCQLMGYEKAHRYVKAYHVKTANFIDSCLRCRGWDCQGFKLITCEKRLSHTPPKPWHYRLRHFAFPWYQQGRVAWCYDGKKGCGRKAAHSFCRRLGFMNARRYKMDPNGRLTKALANQKLCYGKKCKAFEFIDCHR